LGIFFASGKNSSYLLSDGFPLLAYHRFFSSVELFTLKLVEWHQNGLQIKMKLRARGRNKLLTSEA